MAARDDCFCGCWRTSRVHGDARYCNDEGASRSVLLIVGLMVDREGARVGAAYAVMGDTRQPDRGALVVTPHEERMRMRCDQIGSRTARAEECRRR